MVTQLPFFKCYCYEGEEVEGRDLNNSMVASLNERNLNMAAEVMTFTLSVRDFYKSDLNVADQRLCITNNRQEMKTIGVLKQKHVGDNSKIKR